MKIKPRLMRYTQAGFTLIEIMMAVLILGIGLVTLLGLQSSAVDQTVRDRNREYALLTGRRIFAQIEADETIDLQNQQKSLDQMYRDFAGGDRLELPEEEERRMKEFDGRLEINRWGIPDVNPEAMTKISLLISWGESELDRVELVYFIPYIPS